MATIVTRAVKGTALTWTEADANVTNINDDLVLQQQINTDTQDPTGFFDRTNTLSFDVATRTFTITGNHDIYSKGVRYTMPTASIVIPITIGNYYIHYDANNVITAATSFPSTSRVFIAFIYWNGTQAIVADERHGFAMDWATHSYLHNTLGTRYGDGLGLTATNTTFSVTAGSIWDEDNKVTIPLSTTGNVLYYNGSATWHWDEATTLYYKTNGANVYYNNGTALALVASSDFVAYWAIATNDINNPIMFIMGQRVDNTIALARQNNAYQDLEFGSFPITEFKILYRIILKGNNLLQEISDLRGLETGAGGNFIATEHNTLTSIDGGGTYHLSEEQYTDLTDGGLTTLHSHDFADLGDVNLTSPADNAVLGYNLASGKWTNRTTVAAAQTTQFTNKDFTNFNYFVAMGSVQAGYAAMSTDVDLTYNPSTNTLICSNINTGLNTITDAKVGQWDTAYGWGDHSVVGYLTDYTTELSEDLTPVLSGNLDTNGNAIVSSTGILNLGPDIPDARGKGLTFTNLDVVQNTSNRTHTVQFATNTTATVDLTGTTRFVGFASESTVDLNGFNQTSGAGFRNAGLIVNHANTNTGTPGSTVNAMGGIVSVLSLGDDIAADQLTGFETVYVTTSGSPTIDTYTGLLVRTPSQATNKFVLSCGDANANIDIMGKLISGAVIYPNTDGTAGQVLATDGAGNVSFVSGGGGGGIGNVIEDATPQLGGNLDTNGYSIVNDNIASPDINITPGTDGNIILNPAFPNVIQMNGNFNVNGMNFVNLNEGQPNFVWQSSFGGVHENWIDVTFKDGGIRGDNISHSDLSIISNNDGLGNIILDGQKFPNGGGSNGQVLTTDGAGVLSWKNATGSGPYSLGNITGTITPDVANGNVQTATLTGNITLNAFTSPLAGQQLTLILTQDATGNRTLTSTMRAAGGVVGKTLSTAPNAIDILTIYYDGANYFLTLAKGFTA